MLTPAAGLWEDDFGERLRFSSGHDARTYSENVRARVSQAARQMTHSETTRKGLHFYAVSSNFTMIRSDATSSTKMNAKPTRALAEGRLTTLKDVAHSPSDC